MLDLLLQIARVFAVLSLVSIGGANAVLPEIRRQVVVQGWMSDSAFANVFAISHAAPGPNIIMVSLVGWQLAGIGGLLVATLAIMTPSCILADHGAITLIISLGTAAFVVVSRRNPLWAIAAGTAANIVMLQVT